MRERTHIAIAYDAPFLSSRKLVASSGETFDELLLHTERVSRELELPRQGMWDVLLQLTKQTVPLSTSDHSLLKDCGEEEDMTSSGEGAYHLLVGYSRGE